MEKLNQIKGAIFDLDGTLLDSLGAWPNIDCKFLNKRGISLPPDYPQAIKHMPFREAANYTIARFSLRENAEDITAEWLGMTREFYAQEVLLKPFVREYLALLETRGVKLAIATSSHRELFEPALKRLGVWHCFAATLTADEAGKSKAFPDVYVQAAQKLGLSPDECAVFEDVVTATKTARTAGFYTVAVFDEASAHEEEKLKENSDLFIRSFGELLQ